MPRTRMNRNEAKRLDALIALPLARYRTAIARMTSEELLALEARIELLTIKQRWALGGHGIERHRAPNELGLLSRRMAETRREIEERSAATATQLRLVPLEPVERERPARTPIDKAA